MLSKEVKISRVLNGVAAGFGDEKVSAVVDMQNLAGVVFIGVFGALTATAVTKMRVEQSDAADGSGMVKLVGSEISIAVADANKMLVVDVKKPLKRYVRAVISRATADAVIDGVVAVQYGPRKAPVFQPASVAGSAQIVSPEQVV